MLDPAWLAWFRDQFAFVQGWSDALWLSFLEARNPNVPGLVEKIRPSFGRGSLTEQRALWSAVLALEQVPCIYTGRPLDPANFDLDHFLPRSFVAHDRLWNLTPVAPDLNGRKRDYVPDLAFVDRLAAQHTMVDRMEPRLAERPRRVWRKGLDDLAIDFRIDTSREADMLAASYRDVFRALAGIAARMGFKQGWRPENGSA